MSVAGPAPAGRAGSGRSAVGGRGLGQLLPEATDLGDQLDGDAVHGGHPLAGVAVDDGEPVVGERSHESEHTFAMAVWQGPGPMGIGGRPRRYGEDTDPEEGP